MPLPFPNVPVAPGVPQLPRSPAFPPDSNPSLGSQAPTGTLWQASQATPKWGVYDSSGNLVVAPDSIVEFDNRNEARVPNFPVQGGKFANYDKVVLPYEIMLRMVKGGSQTDRTNFLNAVDLLWNSIDSFTVLTPELSYVGVNLARYEVARRGVSGAFFLAEVDLFFTQIQDVEAQYTTTAPSTQNAQQPSAVGPQNQGNVQPQTPTPASVAQASQAVTNQAP